MVLIERITHFGQLKEQFEAGEYDFLFKEISYDKTKLLYKTATIDQKNESIQKAIAGLEAINENSFSKETVKEALMQIADSLPSRGELLHPVRFALSGLDKSPDPFIIAEILGKNETISRLQKAL